MKNLNLKNNPSILIVEDDELIRMELSRELEIYGEVYSSGEKNDIYKLVQSNYFDLAFIDLEINSELLGFEIIEILLVAHGRSHNDTIVTVEQKL